MDVLTLYVGQGSLSAVRGGGEAIIVDAHMPDAEDVSREKIERTLSVFLQGSRVRGLVLTGLDSDHAHPPGVESILSTWTPDWVMYPGCWKDTEAAGDVFATIDRHKIRRAKTNRPIERVSVRLDKLDSRRLEGRTDQFELELFSPHIEDMDNSNNSSIVLAITGRQATGFRYLVTGDTEQERWERISNIFRDALACDVMAAPHHGSINGVHPKAVLSISPHTVLISAGVDNQYGHPDPQAVHVYSSVASEVFSTTVEGGVCLLTRRHKDAFQTHLVSHG